LRSLGKNNIQQHRRVSKRELQNPNVDYTLKEKYELEDAVMFIPLDEKSQLHIHLYKLHREIKNAKQGEREVIKFIDIREYKKKKDEGKFKATGKGVRFELKHLEQLTIRLTALLNKNKRN